MNQDLGGLVFCGDPSRLGLLVVFLLYRIVQVLLFKIEKGALQFF